MYVFGRDRSFRPNMYLDFGLMKKKKLSIDEVKEMIVYLTLYISDFMLVPGKVGNFNCIIDSGKIGVTGFPTK